MVTGEAHLTHAMEPVDQVTAEASIEAGVRSTFIQLQLTPVKTISITDAKILTL